MVLPRPHMCDGSFGFPDDHADVPRAVVRCSRCGALVALERDGRLPLHDLRGAEEPKEQHGTLHL